MKGSGTDVSGRATVAVIDALERDDEDVSGLASGTGQTLGDFRDPKTSWDWTTFAKFHENVLKVVGDDAGLEELGRALYDIESWSFARRIARHTVTPTQLFDAALRVFAPVIFPCIEADVRRVSPRVFDVHLRIPDELPECREFFVISRGHFRAMPSIMDLPDARVTADISGREARYRLEVPPSPSIPRLALRWARAMLGAPSALTELLADYREFIESIEQGDRTRRDMMELLDRLPDGIGFQHGSRIVYANPALLEILDREASEVVGHPVLEFVHPDDRPYVRSRMEQADAHPNPRADVQIQRPDGTIAIAAVEGGQWVDYEGRRVRLTWCRDVTEMRRIQAQLMQNDRMAALGTLAAGVAHEINNPLTWLHASTLALERDIARLSVDREPGPEMVIRMRESAAAALDGTERVRTIAQDLHTFSRPDDDSVQLVDVREVLRGAIRVSAKELSNRASVREEYEEVPQVIANAARLGQVFLNLILNAAQAVDFDSPEKPEISVRSYLFGERVIVEVRDAGRGIPDHLLSRIFEPFFTTKGHDGTGLGLAISHSIITRLGGSIEVESEEGVGTLFRVTLDSAPSARATPSYERVPLRDSAEKLGVQHAHDNGGGKTGETGESGAKTDLR